MTIINRSLRDEQLQGVSTAACGATELHEMRIGEDDVMIMRQVSGDIIIQAGETLSLQPGGLHIMCLDRQAAFHPGEELQLDLHFANAGDLRVIAEVFDEPPPLAHQEH
jgi:copper(I)-binding protein